MKFSNFKPYAKYGLCFLIIINLVGNAYADPSIPGINNLSKPGGIALSWDDSTHIDSCYKFLSIFNKYNATCTINVNELKTQSEIDELNALHSAGWEIASHGYNHVNSVEFISNSTPLAWLDQEIFPSIIEISHYSCPVRTLAYPYSARNLKSDAILAPYFRTLRTDVPRIVNRNVNETTLAYYKWDDARLLYGIEIDDQSGASLQSIEYGIDRAIKTRTVLVLYGHLISPNVTMPYETSTARLESILSYTSRNGGVFYHMGDLGNSSWEPSPRFSNVTANYTVSTNVLSAGKSVTFKDYSVNQTTEMLDFGDGSPTNTTANIIHTYATPGIYTAELTATNDVSSDLMLKTITVTGPTSPVASFTSNSTMGILPLSISFTDRSTGFPTFWSWDFGDGNTSTSQNPVHTYSSAGTHFVNLTVSNINGTSSIIAAITVLEDNNSTGGSSNEGNSGGGTGGRSSGGGSSGGGSGGAGGSPEPQNNVEAKELSQAFITNGNAVRFDFPRDATPVIYISFNSKKKAGKTTTFAEMLKGKSILVSGLPSGEIYKFLNIWVGSSGFAISDNIENAVVCFKVEESWIRDKRIDQSSITLNRYNDGKWNPLSTSLSKEDDEHTYFTAKTPGFSPFAITGKTAANEVVNATQPVTGVKTQSASVNDTQNNTNNGTNTGIIAASLEPASEQKESSSSSDNGNAIMPGFDMVCWIVSLLAVFLYQRG